MTATTKERREHLRRLHEDECESRGHSAYVSNRRVDQIIASLPSLLSDSERLAAIEAVTGEEVRELVDRCQEHLTMSKFLRKEHLLARANDDRELSATAILSLSAKVAEQAEENRASLAEIDRINAIWQEQARIIREQAEEIERLRALAEANAKSSFDMCDMAKATEAERDTLRRLLTETAVPALESALLWLEAAYSIPPQTPDAVLMLRGVKTSISTIRAQMENSTAAPQPERC